MSTEVESTSRRVLRSVILIVMLLMLGGMIAGGLYALRQAPPRRDLAILPPLVETMYVHAQDVVEYFVGYGSANAIHRAQIAAELSATIVERVGDLREGAVVARGQILFRLDDRQYRHVFARAEALAAAERASLDELAVEQQGLAGLIATAQRETRVAREERNRVARLLEQELAAKKEFDFANLAYQQAQRVLQEYELQSARLGPRRVRIAATIRGYDEEAALARLNIDRCEIRAPFDAHIDSLHVDVGDHVVPGVVLATLIDPTRVEVAVRLPASIHDRVHVGAPCRLTSESTPSKRLAAGSQWTGLIARVGPTADARTRTFAAYVVIDNAGQAQSGETDLPALVPGVFVTARIQGPTHPDRILVPRRACRGGRVFVVEDNRARARSVVVERYLEDQAMVRGDGHSPRRAGAGLRSGDRVILSRLDRLVDGSPVRTREPTSVADKAESLP